MQTSPLVSVFFLRKEDEDHKGAEEAAPHGSVCTDGGCWWFSEVQGLTPPCRRASQREEAASCHLPSKNTPPCWLVIIVQPIAQCN